MYLPRQTSRRRAFGRGFTLMELITVITIVAILASILVPIAGKASLSAKKRKSVLLFNNLANSFEAYRAEYGHYPIFPELGAKPNISSLTLEKDYNFQLNASNNLLRQVLTADSNYMASANSSGATNYNGKQKPFLVLNESYLTTTGAGTNENPAIVDGFGNDSIGVVIHVGYSREIDKNAFTLPVSDPDQTANLAPSVVRNLPQPIAIYSLVQNYEGDPISSTWNTNWSYDDYSQ